jgi:hypothetical protein
MNKENTSLVRFDDKNRDACLDPDLTETGAREKFAALFDCGERHDVYRGFLIIRRSNGCQAFALDVRSGGAIEMRFWPWPQVGSLARAKLWIDGWYADQKSDHTQETTVTALVAVQCVVRVARKGNREVDSAVMRIRRVDGKATHCDLDRGRLAGAIGQAVEQQMAQRREQARRRRAAARKSKRAASKETSDV